MVQLAGSAPLAVADRASIPLAASEQVSLTVVLARREPLTADPDRPLPPAVLAERHGADPDALAALERYVTAAGLSIVDAQPEARLVQVTGPASAVQAAFGTGLAVSGPHRVPTGPVQLPAELAGQVLAVLGLDTRPAARHQTALLPHADPRTAYTPVELAARYGFPAEADGQGQTVAIIELGGGFRRSDLVAYADSLGLPHPHVSAVSVQGAVNAPTGDPAGPDGEVALDIEVVAGAAPGARIAVYFAPNTDAGFVAAVSRAAHDHRRKVSVLSISWGAAEVGWTQQALTAFDAALADAAALGISVCVASGDDGSNDRVGDGGRHVDFPASSPHALGCGGSALPAHGPEVVWNDGPGRGAGGGGVSTAFPTPEFQAGLDLAGAPLAGRGVPDVAADADPLTGYRVRIDGTDTVIGGTSAAAPLWAALIARLNQATGSPRWLTPLLYRMPPTAFTDITDGNNGAYAAGPGWDACTGLGSPVGSGLLAALRAAGTAGLGSQAAPSR